MCNSLRTVRRMMLLGLLAITAGCGSSAAESEVIGKVVYKGDPVNEGQVNLVDPHSGQAAIAPLDAAGSFAVAGKLAPGKYAVYITPAPPQPLPPGQKQKKAEKPPLPAKVNDPTKSGMEVTLIEGKNDLVIEVPQ